MDSTSEYFIKSITEAVLGRPAPDPPADLDPGRFISTAYNQGFVCIAADMADRLTGADPDTLEKLAADARMLKAKEKFRNIYLNDLFDKLEDRGLFSMPIKGFVIKDLYPKPYMREMNDVDVLIDPNQLDEVRRVLEENGYVYDHTSTHEVVFNLDPFINLELHTRLTSVYHGDKYKLFDDAWERAVPAGGKFKHRMTAEDLYIHALTHFAMHYETSGGGVKPVVDLWLIRRELKKDPNPRYDYIAEKIEKLGFSKFDSVITRLGEIWFEGAEHTPLTRQTETLLMLNGAYGSIENYTMLRFYRLAEHDKNPIVRKAKVLLSVMFNKRAIMEIKYPGLKGRPYLYPYYTVVRWFQILTKRKGDVKSMADVVFNSGAGGYGSLMDEVIDNNKQLGFEKSFFDKKFYD